MNDQTTTPEPEPRDARDDRIEALTSIIGMGIHTGLRKFADSEASGRAWSAIQAMPDEEWHVVAAEVAKAIVRRLEEGSL